jgi:hypothetical protein
MNIEASQSYAGRKLIKILGSNHIVILQCWVLYKYRIQAYFGYLSTNESPQLSGLWRIVLAACSDEGGVLEKCSSLPGSAPVLCADQKISPLSC